MSFKTIGGIPAMTHLEFLDRFTDAEIIGIREAAKQVPQVDAWLYRFERSTLVDVSDQRTQAGVQALEDFGLLDVGRASQILA